MTPGAWRALRVGVGALLLAGVLALAGTGGVLVGVAALDVRVVLAGCLLAVPATVACAWRWRLVARGLGSDLALGPAVAACYCAQFLNTVLPGGVLGDVHRGIRQGVAAGDTGRALRAVAWERVAGQAVLGVLTLVALLAFPSPVPRWLGVVVLALLVVGAWPARRLLVRPSPPEPASWPARLRRAVATDLRVGVLAPGVWPGIVVASVVAVACYAATYVVAARAVGVTAPLSVLLPIVMLVFVAAALPTNVAGWGPREGMAAWAFAAAGLGADQGLATAVAFALMVLVANLPGALVLLVSTAQGTRARSSVDPSDEPDPGRELVDG